MNVGFKDITTPTHEWVDTDFWNLFDENKYDVIQTGRSGHPEYPFTLINKTPIVDSIHLSGMAEDKHNVFKTVLVSEQQRKKWIAAGGNPNKGITIPVPVEVPKYNNESYRDEFGWKDKFVFGMHQRDDNNIFSPIPLEAYDEIESDDTAFLILGGSANHRKQARDLRLNNVQFLDTASDIGLIHKFLNTLDVYAHGRSDGEQCSSSIIEGLSHGLPMISHSAASMGQVEQIGDAGEVVDSYEEYADVMRRMIDDSEYYNQCVSNSSLRYNKVYNIKSIIDRFVQIYMDIVND